VNGIDIAPSRGGKTHRMLLWLAEDKSRVCMTFNEQESTRLRAEAARLELGLRDDQFISAHRRDGLLGRHVELGVDNAEMVLAVLLGRPIARMTVTG
jgi:hypothetical protein